MITTNFHAVWHCIFFKVYLTERFNIQYFNLNFITLPQSDTKDHCCLVECRSCIYFYSSKKENGIFYHDWEVYLGSYKLCTLHLRVFKVINFSKHSEFKSYQTLSHSSSLVMNRRECTSVFLQVRLLQFQL